MTKQILVSALWFAFACKSGIVGSSNAEMQAGEASPCLSEKEAIEQLKAIRKEIEQGEDFAKLAGIYSQDPGSSEHGGDLGWAEKGMLVSEYEVAMLALQPNGISMPVKTKFGYHLIQLMEVKGDRYRSRHILLRPCKQK